MCYHIYLISVMNVGWQCHLQERRGQEGPQLSQPCSSARLRAGSAPRMVSGAAGNVHSAGEAWGITGSVDVALSERLFSFPLLWLGRKGKEIQVTHGI